MRAFCEAFEALIGWRARPAPEVLVKPYVLLATEVVTFCLGHSTLSSQCVCEGAWLTQLVLLVTAGRLFLGHKGRVDLYIDECLYHYVWFGHKGFLLQVSL